VLRIDAYSPAGQVCTMLVATVVRDAEWAADANDTAAVETLLSQYVFEYTST
jgi:hypothetical protein